MRSEVKVVCVNTGFFSGMISPNKIENALSSFVAQGWQPRTQFLWEKRFLFIFRRVSLFTVLTRDC